MKKSTRRNNEPLVSIIILNHNNSWVTLECLEAIRKFTKPKQCEILLIDNGSRLKEINLLRSVTDRLVKFPIKFIKLNRNQGFTKPANLGAAIAKGKYLVFLNNDVIVTPNWLEPLILVFKTDPLAAACGPKLHSYIEKDYFDYSGGAGGFIDIFGYPFTRGRVFNNIEVDIGQYDDSCEISWASGSCLVVRACLFRQIGGFDEYYFAYCEEVDLCFRLRQKGYKIFYVGESLVYHWGAVTSNQNLPKKIYLNHRNHLYFFLKNYSIWPNLPIIMARFFLDLASLFYYLGQFNLSFVGALIKADWQVILKVPHLIKKRVLSWHGRSLMSDRTVYKGSIVLKYFIFQQKTFEQIILGRKRKETRFKKYNQITYYR